MSEIRLAIVGVGNCASALVQGLSYYAAHSEREPIGLMHESFAGYRLSDIKIVAAFDVDARKVGRDVAEAIFAKPNCTTVFHKEVAATGVKVSRGPVLDGVAPHMADMPAERAFRVSDTDAVDVAKVLTAAKADVIISYLPVGSEQATQAYAKAALDAGCGFVNCIPVFIASNREWADAFRKKGLPIVGDDIKSQLGATITHRVLTRLFDQRGVKVDRTYQLNTGGNTDFLNMKAQDRLSSKKISKTESVQSQLTTRLPDEDIHIGPSDYVPWQKDNKVCFIRIEGRKWGDVPIELEMRLSVEDSPNSAGVAIDAIRACKVALDRGEGGPIRSASAYLMKHPAEQLPDHVARAELEAFIKGDG